MALNRKQEMFIEKYAECGDNRQALQYAGYSCNDKKSVSATATRIMKMEEAKQYLAEVKEKLVHGQVRVVCMSKDKVVNAVMDIVDDVEQRACDRLKGLDMICKMFGYYSPVDVNKNVNVTISNELEAARRRLIEQKEPKTINVTDIDGNEYTDANGQAMVLMPKLERDAKGHFLKANKNRVV